MNIQDNPVDSLDIRLLRELSKDSRRSYRELSKEVNVAVGTVLSRIKRMEKSGIIQGYTSRLDYEQLGYELTVVTEVTVSKGRLVDVENAIAKEPHVCAVYDVTGLTDAIIIAKFRNRADLNRFTKTILAIPHVERTNTHVVLNTIKENFSMSLDRY
jgi:DNA-binding Lrp family transcriptional regulator